VHKIILLNFILVKTFKKNSCEGHNETGYPFHPRLIETTKSSDKTGIGGFTSK
jgi:hypothetical protein